MKGKFISFEGSDGAGKTSVLKAIRADLEKQLGAPKVMYTREPGGDRISEQIRRVLVDRQNTDMDSRTEALLFAASRRQHVVEDLRPALAAGKVILCDRYVDSSIAYQGAGRRLGEQAVWQINRFAIDGLLPELTIYLDIPTELGLRRIATHRADQINRLDQEQLTFYQAVRHSYLRLQKADPQRIKKIDASQPLDQVVNDVKIAIHTKFPELFTDEF
jgi:dTMP kinase